MKYPKLWNGPSPVGEALVRALQRVRSPWLSSRSGGTVSNTLGGRSEVFHGNPPRYYAYHNTPGGKGVLRGSVDYRAPFTPLSSIPDVDALIYWDGLLYPANGRVYTRVSDAAGSSFNRQVKIFQSRSVKATSKAIVSAQYGVLSPYSYPDFTGGVAYAKDEGGPHFGFSFPAFAGGTLQGLYLALLPELATTTVWSHVAENPSYTSLETFSIHRSDATTLYAFSLAIDRLTQKRVTGIPSVLRSTDNGAVWSDITPAGFVDYGYSVVDQATGPTSLPSLYRPRLTSAPGADGLVVLVHGNLWNNETKTPPAEDGNMNEVWFVSGAGVDVRTTDAQMRGAMGDAGRQPYASTAVRTKDAVFALVRKLDPATPGQNKTARPRLLKFTLSGELVSVAAICPVERRFVGAISAADGGEILCPMFDQGDAEHAPGIYVFAFSEEEGGFVRKARLLKIGAAELDALYGSDSVTSLPTCGQVVFGNTTTGGAVPAFPAAPELSGFNNKRGAP